MKISSLILCTRSNASCTARDNEPYLHRKIFIFYNLKNLTRQPRYSEGEEGKKVGEMHLSHY